MCFDLSWWENLLIWVVIIGAIVAILKLLVPLVLQQFGWPAGLIMQIINIVIVAMVIIFVIIFAFGMISCLSSIGGGVSGLHLPGHAR
jgi:hypothetical protein